MSRRHAAVVVGSRSAQTHSPHPIKPNTPKHPKKACILRRRLKRGLGASPDNLPELRIVLQDSLLAAEALVPPFLRAVARQGWMTDKIVVEAHRRRARW